jgi:phage gp36-like protein
MKKILLVLFFVLALLFPAFSGTAKNAGESFSFRNFDAEGIMAYCTLEDLEAAYSAEQIGAWSRLDPDKVDKAIQNASAEIDGYLISGGYAVPLSGPPQNLKKYCVDIAAASLIRGAGILSNDPGGEAALEEAKNARHYHGKITEGKYKIPGYVNPDSELSTPPGGIKVSSPPKLDLRGF